MFLRFGFENDYCFRDRQEVTLVAEKPTGHDHHRLPCPGTDFGLVPVLAVFGANASGKSRALLALESIAILIRDLHSNLEPDEELPRNPFLLDPTSRDAPTKYDCDFMLEDADGRPVRHHYAFSYDDHRILDEALYYWPNGTRRVLFQRSASAPEPWYFGPSLKGKKRDLASFTGSGSLFLASAAKNNHAELGRIARAITGGLLRTFEWDLPEGALLTEKLPVLAKENRDLVLELLAAADLGISSVRTRDRRQVIEEAMTQLPDDEDGKRQRRYLRQKLESFGAPVELQLLHKGAEDTWFSLDLESRGTVRLLMHLSPVIQALSTGALLLADELEEALHPRLCSRIIALFESPRSNPLGAQLIFTTHHDALLEERTRDEVLLVDKGPDGAATLTPLSDFQLRPRDNLRRAYVEGRVGGVPRVGSLEHIVARRLGSAL